METKRVILARFVDLDVTPTKVLPWQPDVMATGCQILFEKSSSQKLSGFKEKKEDASTFSTDVRFSPKLICC